MFFHKRSFESCFIIQGSPFSNTNFPLSFKLSVGLEKKFIGPFDGIIFRQTTFLGI